MEEIVSEFKLVAKKLTSPFPLAGKPIFGFELVHSYCNWLGLFITVDPKSIVALTL